MDSDRDQRFEKARELRNSTPLKRYKTSNYPEVQAVVDCLFNEMVLRFELDLSRKSSVQKLKHHIEFFVLNLYKVHSNDPTKVIAYSRDRNAYSGKKSKYKKYGLSFRYSVDEGKYGKPVITFLEKGGYIETFSFQHDKSIPGNSFQSRMRAAPKLIDLIEKHLLSAEQVELDTSGEETIVIKGVKPKPTRKRVIENGKVRTKKVQKPRKVCKTPDTPLVREMRKNLEIINEVMDRAEITLDISGDELRQLNQKMLKEDDPNKQPVDFSRKRLHRVFLDRRLDRGGRFYGAWYQNIPKEYRQKIMIDGAPTLELDYSALHPNLLYHLAGATPPAGDLYELDGYSSETRKFLKGMFLRMINSSSRIDAKGSIRKAAFKDGKIVIPTELENLEDKYLDPLIDKFLEKHSSLKGYIFQIKNLGNILQNIDSHIAEKVLLYFAYIDIPVLPIHDSFMINEKLLDELREIMNRVITKNFGSSISISCNKEFLPLPSWSRFLDIIQGNIVDEYVVSLLKDLRLQMKERDKLVEKSSCPGNPTTLSN